MNILMAAAENDALPGGKVGGIGDVVRDIPKALVDINHHVDVVTPSYGRFNKLPNAKYITTIQVDFAGNSESIEVFKLSLSDSKVEQWVLEHPLFAVGGEGKIYCNDPDNRPFATDATKFALFSTAVAKAIINDVFGDIQVLHLHDWHAAVISILRQYDGQYKKLKTMQCVYTIHNLALQGIRPFDGDESSLKAWFPNLSFDSNQIKDPRYHNCFNPVRAGINLCDKVHAVSPTYAKEILQPSEPSKGYIGGEGLEYDLLQAAHSNRLHGILNGCEYPEAVYKRLSYKKLTEQCESELLNWISDNPLKDASHLVAMTRLRQLLVKNKDKKPVVLTSVGRITDQKMSIFMQKMPDGQCALAHLLHILKDDGVFILLGSGDSKIENHLSAIALTHNNFVFLKGYSQTLSDDIYRSGDLFLMPSSFEPCGISQMFAMRAGQPCLAHSVGGLADTIIDGKNGFTFNGSTPTEQAENLLNRFQTVLEQKSKNSKQWNSIKKEAAKDRFSWKDVAIDYTKYLYTSS